jgi:hypothetical protein
MIESKEKNHGKLCKFYENLQTKILQIIKNYKTEEKNFLTTIQKVSKEMTITNDKIGK